MNHESRILFQVARQYVIREPPRPEVLVKLVKPLFEHVWLSELLSYHADCRSSACPQAANIDASLYKRLDQSIVVYAVTSNDQVHSFSGIVAFEK